MQSESSHNPTNGGHATLVVNVRAIVWWLVALMVLIVVTLVLMELLMTFYAAEDVAARPGAEIVKLPITHQFPLLDERQSQELLKTRELAHQLLNQYTWLDRQTGVARIPIERAMQILVRSGLPDVPSPADQQKQP